MEPAPRPEQPVEPETLDEVVSGAWTGFLMVGIAVGVFVAAALVAAVYPSWQNPDRRWIAPPRDPVTMWGVARLGLLLILALAPALWLAYLRRDERLRAKRRDDRARAMPSLANGHLIRAVARPGSDCPFCQDALAPDDLGEGVVRCPACEVSHHTACWKEHEGCSTLGCRRDPHGRKRQSATQV